MTLCIDDYAYFLNLCLLKNFTVTSLKRCISNHGRARVLSFWFTVSGFEYFWSGLYSISCRLHRNLNMPVGSEAFTSRLPPGQQEGGIDGHIS